MVDLRPSQQQMIRSLRVNYMESIRSCHQSYSQIKDHRTKSTGQVPQKLDTSTACLMILS